MDLAMDKLTKGDEMKNTQLQTVVSVLRNWVLDQVEDFTIMDIYAQPDLSAKLEVHLSKMLLIDQALIELGCTIPSGQENVELRNLRYTPPLVVRIDRDLLCA
jgi:hypothetical protein